MIKPKNKEQKQAIDVLDRCINLRIGEDCNNKVSGRQQRIDDLFATFGTQRSSTVEMIVPWRVDLSRLSEYGYSALEIKLFELRIYDLAAKRMKTLA